MPILLNSYTHYDPIINRQTSIHLDNPEELSDNPLMEADDDENNDTSENSNQTDEFEPFYRNTELHRHLDLKTPDDEFYDRENDVPLSDDIKYNKLPLKDRVKPDINTDISTVLRRSTGSTIYDQSIMTSELNYRLREGYTYEEALNIEDTSEILLQGYSQRYELKKDAYKLLDKKYPLDDVLDFMNKSVLKNPIGTYSYPKGMLGFIAKFPDKRGVVVHQAKMGELFKPVTFKYYEKIYDASKNDDTEQILNECTLHDSILNTRQDANKDLCELAIVLLENNNKIWDENSSKIINSIKYKTTYNDEKINSEKYAYAYRMASIGKNNQDIAERINRIDRQRFF